MNDARLWHPRLRINRVLRVMLHRRWSGEAWSALRLEFRKASRAAEPDLACGVVSTRLVTAPSSRGAMLVRVVAFG
jgi:hypothetical protein